MAGVIHQIDKVICVKPLRTGYRPDIGDVVVGRIVQVDQKRWMVDVNSYQHAVLNLTSINLPGGIQRRRSEEDQLNMRNFFKEGDIISAEVMQVNSNDGRIMLQTRNLKYGKLLNGFMLKTDSNYIRRMKNHIINFLQDHEEVSVGSIIGTNGYVWVYSPTANQLDKKADVKVPQLKSVSKRERECMSVVRNAIVCLEREQLPIFKETIELVLAEYFKLEESNQLTPLKMLNREDGIGAILCEQARSLIEKEISSNMKQFDIQRL